MEPLAEDSTRHWAEPGTYEVAPDVYRIPLPIPDAGLRAVNVYAITGGSGIALVDAGWATPEAREALRAGLAALGGELADVREVLVTHMHGDHYTQAVTLRREFGCRVTLGEFEKASVRASSSAARTMFGAQAALLRRCGAEPMADELRATFGTGPRHTAELYDPPDEWLAEGPRTVPSGRRLEVVHTPGHTAGHVVFVDGAAGLLFSGDHVLPHITPSIGFEPEPVELPLRDFLDSLRRVRTMPDRRLLPAHGPVTGSAHSRVDELLAHHDRRLELTARAVAAGSRTAFAAAHELTWTRRGRRLPELDLFNRMLAVIETKSHLDLLVAEDRLAMTELDGVRHYTPS
ncbi:Glyoxylase, beta-lactamase superfamily II [Amycolatopsis arida]|uniref:Glyoxylase, beta-lactamase superfamily II n=1 Tax=Amycolatopsis arida TaxID=587909 RepID=A0A1I5NX07_9PSEU|nr:MBL fold metallo-hydrolase [Amycolatopsis arida]TDX98273.1 glyoxylase-like metal-dependent hydrolase (beta-lactamase superfamily II) [Amycolatopsis arida]SFP26314.1 Glyoxylase, beta-lactamase superfamily II [Amycolatopsis arida]